MADPVPIAFCITELDPGGAERALVQLVTRLNRNDWSPAVYSLGPRGPLADDLEQHGIPTVSFDGCSKRSLFVLRRLQHELRRQRPAILQTFLFHANVMGGIAARRSGVPIVVSGIRVAERGQRWHLWLERATRRLVTHHVCVSQSVADFSTTALGLRADQVSVIPNGVDFERFANARPADLTTLGIPAGSKTLLYVGRLHAQKGVETLIEAIRPLVDRHSELHLLIVGAGPLERDLVAKARSRTSQIHFAGRRDDVPELMRASSALVLPSLWEGLPNVVLEAMAAGLPVIATDADGSRDLVRPGETGWLAEAGSESSLRQAVTDWLRSAPDAVSRISKTAQNIVSERFTWDESVARYSELYRHLMTATCRM